MYGLLLENLSEYIKSVYGEEKWEDIRRQAGIDSPSFSVHQVYPENLLNKLAKKAQQSKNITREQKELLVTLLEEDIALANDRFDSPNGKMEIREGWQRISLQLNSLGGATKEADKWKKAWIDMKKYVRAQWAILKEYDNRTGLGTHVTTRRPNQLSHLDERILSVITTEAVEGTSTSEGGAFLSASRVLGVSEREFMDQMGVYFVNFVSQYGYDRVLSVLGRHMRDFLNGLDNLHEYLKFSYPRMRAPSFICENETRQGLTLHYRSKRRGFVYYTMGQIREVARHFYQKEMHIELVREEILFDTVHVTFQLTFDNRAFTLASLAMTREEKHLPISASVLFEIFPFCIVFGSDLIVRSIGNSLMVILPDLVGKKITNWFELVRPLIAFKFQTILNRTNNIFELVTVESVPESPNNQRKNEILEVDNHTDESDGEKNLRLKGQMIYMDNWKMIMFLGTPVMPDLTSLINTGLYINDLSMHDFSRDLMLAGTQQSVELKLALDQEQQKSKKLEESMRKLDEEMRRTDELLYQMIPKQVADRLRRGENPIDTCEMFDSVSILFSDVVTFTEICSRITPMEVVSMLNAMYSIFDKLTERNNVYKVETIGDAYMVVSGAPEKEQNHAEKVCDMALDMVEAITDLKDPSTGDHLRIRVGVHSGAVVAGIVGLKMPRYCLFGDSVNTASRMESTSSAMKIHISESTNDLLGPIYKVIERGEIDVKGKGSMKTYWLVEREHRKPLSKVMPNLATELAEKPITPLGSGTIERKPLSAERRRSISQTIKNHVDLMRDRERNPDRDSTASALSNEVDRRVYSPVTFQDVARHSTANSPVKTLFGTSNRGRESRSNSTGHVFMHSPSDVFGSLISDTEDFLEDLHTNNHHRNSLGPSTYKSPISSTSSPPFSPPNMRLSTALSKPITPGNFSEDELSMLDQMSPSPSAPANMDKYALDIEIKNSKLKDFKSNVSAALSASTITTTSILPTSLASTTSLNSTGSITSSTTPMSVQHSINRKGILKNNQAKALEKLDKMVEEMFDTNIAGMCPLNFLPPPPPPSSKSDSNLCAHHRHHHIDDLVDNNDNTNNSSNSNNNNNSIDHPHNHSYLHHHHHHHHQQQQQQQQQRITNSQSFVHHKDHQCCAGFGHPTTQNGRPRIHSHACQII